MDSLEITGLHVEAQGFRSVTVPIAGVCPQYYKSVPGCCGWNKLCSSLRITNWIYGSYGKFNAHVGIDTDTWKGVIGKHGVTGLNENGRYLLQLCCSNGLRIMNTFFQHREVHKYTWYGPSMDQKSLIDFCIVSSDLFSNVLDVRVKRGAELSTDHHLVVRSLRLSKPRPNKRSNRSSVTYRIKWEALEDKEVRKQFASSISSKFSHLVR